MESLILYLQPVPNVVGPNVHTSGTKNIVVTSFETSGTLGHIIRDQSDVDELLLGKLNDIRYHMPRKSGP